MDDATIFRSDHDPVVLGMGLQAKNATTILVTKEVLENTGGSDIKMQPDGFASFRT